MKKLLAAVLVAMFAMGIAACDSTNDISDPDHVLNQDRG
jgi:uncharacterized lipoprotein